MFRLIELGLATATSILSSIPVLICTMIELPTSLIIVGVYFDADSGRRHFDDLVGLGQFDIMFDGWVSRFNFEI